MTSSAFLEALLSQLRAHERHDPHNADVRLVVRLRARDACEYCLLPTSGKFEVDHIIPARLWTAPSVAQAGPRHHTFSNLDLTTSTISPGPVPPAIPRRQTRRRAGRDDVDSDSSIHEETDGLTTSFSCTAICSSRACRGSDRRRSGRFGSTTLVRRGRSGRGMRRSWPAGIRRRGRAVGRRVSGPDQGQCMTRPPETLTSSPVM